MTVTRRQLFAWGAGTLAATTLGTGAAAWIDTTTIALHSESLSSAKLTAPLRVLHLTDLHDADPARIPQALAHLERAQPHMIALTGDYVNTHTRDFTGVGRWFSSLAATGVPTFAVWGNHDHWNGRLDRLRALLDRAGIRLLVNETATLDGPHGRVDVLGTDDPYTHRADLPAALASARADAFRLVLAHSPDIADALGGSGVDLALCGHTHGGQIRAPLIGALYAPGQGFLPPLSLGTHLIAGTPLHISGGIGTTGPPVRLFSPSTVDLITVAATPGSTSARKP